MSSKEKKSISQLEGWSWNMDIPKEEDSSYEEYNFYLLHNKPIKDFSVADIYFMIGQESGLKYFIPMSIDYLLKDLFLTAEDYPGDLLRRVLNIEASFWLSAPKEHGRLLKALNEKWEDEKEIDTINEIRKALISSRDFFLQLKI